MPVKVPKDKPKRKVKENPLQLSSVSDYCSSARVLRNYVIFNI